MTIRGDLLHAADVMLVHGLLRDYTPQSSWGVHWQRWPWRGVSLAGAVYGAIAQSDELEPRQVLTGEGMHAETWLKLRERCWQALNAIAEVLGEPVTEVFQWGNDKTTGQAVQLLVMAADESVLYLPTSSSLSSSSW